MELIIKAHDEAPKKVMVSSGISLGLLANSYGIDTKLIGSVTITNKTILSHAQRSIENELKKVETKIKNYNKDIEKARENGCSKNKMFNLKSKLNTVLHMESHYKDCLKEIEKNNI